MIDPRRTCRVPALVFSAALLVAGCDSEGDDPDLVTIGFGDTSVATDVDAPDPIDAPLTTFPDTTDGDASPADLPDVTGPDASDATDLPDATTPTDLADATDSMDGTTDTADGADGTDAMDTADATVPSCGDGTCDASEGVDPRAAAWCAADCGVLVILELDATGDVLPLPALDDPPPPAGTGNAFVTGDQMVWGPWTPNSVALADDGSMPDLAPADNLWTREFTFPAGQAVRYKYTIGNAGDSWGGTEEWPAGNDRGFVVPVDGTSVIRVRDVFGDEPAMAGTLAATSRMSREAPVCIVDGVCTPTAETIDSCAMDCSCGDGVCDAVEAATGPGDAAWCEADCACIDNGVCSADEDLGCADCSCDASGTCEPARENAVLCAMDCNCGDGVCDPSEAAMPASCARDCICEADGVCTQDEYDASCSGTGCASCDFDGTCDSAAEMVDCSAC